MKNLLKIYKTIWKILFTIFNHSNYLQTVISISTTTLIMIIPLEDIVSIFLPLKRKTNENPQIANKKPNERQYIFNKPTERKYNKVNDKKSNIPDADNSKKQRPDELHHNNPPHEETRISTYK